MSKRTQLHWKIVFCLWFVVVTIATHTPAMQESETPTFISPDKLFHFVSFGVLAMTFWSTGWIKDKRKVLWLFILWSVVDELTQALLPLGRPFSVADLIASVLGIVAAASWMGMLTFPQLREVQTKVDMLLSRTIVWFVLCPVALIGAVGTSAVIWKILWNLYQVSFGPLSLCLGLIITATVLLSIISIWAQCLEKKILKKLFPTLLVLGIVAIIIGFATSDIEVGAYTIGLTFFTIGSARIWRATITDKSTWGTM
ncbi:MAG: VanZ family protein [Planctomycetes bacterium]|nr:VanZ family protein [Planctomycetota bacterium]